jgi:hypothetical protein
MKKLLLIIGGILLWKLSILAEPVVGQTYRFSFGDVDGNELSTADGRFNVIVLSSKANSDKARIVGDRIPDFCLGNANYRMITIVAFETKHSNPVRAVLRAAIRHRLDSEAQRLQKRYQEHQISREARHDVFAVADFDGVIAARLDLKPDVTAFRVFVFGRNGELLKQWSDVPSGDELASALKQD